ncbi:hypothetical protein GCM10017600_57850 [Streptosporangium carneum]|uniref:Uncharacterized protein n=1 Tax=Streptosporangium carneum TaxID=47481 RepID=A0A9W6I5C4_9ACTN|nr:hypothetical protein GCM10017600_57850 [Streptosporangium carneum]
MAEMGVQIVPDEHDGAAELLVDGIQQTGVVAFGETAPLALTAAAQPDAIDHPAAVPGLEADHAGDRHPARAFP